MAKGSARERKGLAGGGGDFRRASPQGGRRRRGCEVERGLTDGAEAACTDEVGTVLEIVGARTQALPVGGLCSGGYLGGEPG
jgi:hypothetical protein